MVKEPKVTILILNWNGCQKTIKCLKSLQKITYHNYQIVVVDNGSIDNSVEKIKDKFPHIALIQNKKNLGFAAGNNVGIKYALKSGADYVFLLNNDTVAEPEFLGELIKIGEGNANVGAVQCKILRENDHTIVDSVGQVFFPVRGAKDIQSGDPDEGKFDEVQEIFGACAAAALFKSKIFKEVGMFEEDFFCIFEDVDLSWRIRLAGYRILLAPKSVVYHERGVSGKSTSQSRYYASRNQLYLVIKYYPLALILQFFPFHLYRLIGALYYSVKTGHNLNILVKGIHKNIKKRKFIQVNPGINELWRRWVKRVSRVKSHV